MREILFRGKVKNTNEWKYGDLRHWTKKSVGIHHQELHTTLRVIPETVGQFTGLTDKNGTKIWEGDIVKKGFELFVVKWNAEQCRFDLYTNKNNIQSGLNVFSQKYFEIIGNITDNPELLGDK